MRKIIAYLDVLNITCVYVSHYIGKHYNGASFYNDGTYGVDIYALSNGYEIHHKCSGRPFYWLYRNGDIVRGGASQAQFIEYVLNDIFAAQ